MMYAAAWSEISGARFLRSAMKSDDEDGTVSPGMSFSGLVDMFTTRPRLDGSARSVVNAARSSADAV